ncbi:MAG: hypothetical protein IPO93_00445 [Actinobacteria bacterium]|nr:hypothetical protein [Actinomycetota bacterium]
MPLLSTLRRREDKNACWRRMREVSEPSPRVCRARTKASASLALDEVLALVELESAQRIVDRLRQADLDAADRVDDALEAAEVDEHEVVDVQARHLLDGLDRAAGSADLDGEVEAGGVPADLLAVLLADRQRDHRVSGDADADGRLSVGADVQDDDGVGVLRVAELLHAAEAAVALAGPSVAAHEHDVQRIVGARLLVDLGEGLHGRRGSELLADVDGGDVALQLAHDDRDSGTDHGGHEDEGRHHGEDHSRHVPRGGRTGGTHRLGLLMVGRVSTGTGDGKVSPW